MLPEQTRIRVTDQPVSARPFVGLGVQADACIHNDMNKKMGVNEKDIALFEARTMALRPSIARIFISIGDYNPSLDAKTFVWDGPDFAMQLRQLRLLQKAGARVNICSAPWTNDEMVREGMEEAALALVKRLREVEGMDNIGWLTLFNEPDGIYFHDTPLYHRIFGGRERKPGSLRPLWAEYVAKHRRTLDRMKELGLYPQVKLIVPDTVWGHPMRVERMNMAARDFAGLDLAWGYHTYNAEWPSLKMTADYQFPGTAPEAVMYRQLLGESAELVIWEFNNAGTRFGAFFPGTDEHGEDLLGTYKSATVVCQKVFDALNNGVDGAALWCAGDMYYLWEGCGPMRFGLWRYKWEHWAPRPVYYYFAALCNALRPGMTLLRTTAAEGLLTLAARDGDDVVVAVVNTGAHSRRVDVQGIGGPLRRLRVHQAVLPTADEMPITADETIDSPVLELAGWELTVLRGHFATPCD